MVKIYHNPRCKKSREGLKYLREKCGNFEIIDYLNKPFVEKELQEILVKMNKKPFEIVRTEEEFYKKELKNRNFTDEEWIQILLENPKLIMRPIVLGKYKAVIAQPAEKIDLILNTETKN